ncbi:MAG: cofactor-independent phosphoglycerate mutase [Syntrophobacteraceae bacterium]
MNDRDPRYVILVGDGMGDYALPELGGRTPLEAARTPNLDRLAGIGRMGTLSTIPEGMEPGSDVANMSLLGYDPGRYHTGRAPLEAASLGIALGPEDVAFRCNLVTLDQSGDGIILMGDYSAGHITTPEAHAIIQTLQGATEGLPLRLYPGVSYRHLLVWQGGRDDLPTTPPHDITGQPTAQYAAVYESTPVLKTFVERAAVLLDSHPVNVRREAEAHRRANAVWLWGQGRAPSMPTLSARAGLTGAMISAVDLLKGLGVYAGLDAIAVPGATGYLDTNYPGKVEAALKALEQGNFVYVHIEAPDEAGHEGSLSKKMEAIEAFDERVVAPMVAGLARFPRTRLLIVTDHMTPISKRTHVTDPVPFLLVPDLGAAVHSSASGKVPFCEASGHAAGLHLGSGMELFDLLLGNSPFA